MKRKQKKTAPEQNPLSEEELSMLKNAVASEEVDRSTLPHFDNSDRAKFFRAAKKNKYFTAVCILLCTLVVALLAMCVVIAVNIAKSKPNTDDFTVIIDGTEYTAAYENAMRGDILYIDMCLVAKHTELIKSGTDTDVKFTTKEQTNYVRFENNSHIAVINGTSVEMEGVAITGADTCEVPLSFLQKAIGSKENGLLITLNEQTNTVKITRTVYATDKKDVYTPVEIKFTADGFNQMQSIEKPSGGKTTYEYLINIDSLMSSIDPDNKEKYLVLVNKQNPLGSTYEPSDLEYIRDGDTNGKAIKLRRDAEVAVSAMLREMQLALRDTKEEQYKEKDVFVTSAYRDYSYQEDTFEKYVNRHMTEDGMTREEAVAAALEYSAQAGYSEHQSGLCVDITNRSVMNGRLEEYFDQTEEFKWLQKNAHKFGFILRYPEGKESITGYTYEPWHYRFVGRTVATEIYSSGLCLEEYLAKN